MERIVRIFENHEEADLAAREDDNALNVQERFAAFMTLMKPYYDAAPGFQRILRIDDCRQRSICDDWGVRIQPLPEPTSDG